MTGADAERAVMIATCFAVSRSPRSSSGKRFASRTATPVVEIEDFSRED